MGWSDIVNGDLVVFFVVLKSMAISVVLEVLRRRLLMEHHDDTLSTSRLYIVSSLFFMSPRMVVSSAYLNILTELSKEVS